MYFFILPSTACSPDPCGLNGECNNVYINTTAYPAATPIRYYCKCTEGWTGRHCDRDIPTGKYRGLDGVRFLFMKSKDKPLKDTTDVLPINGDFNYQLRRVFLFEAMLSHTVNLFIV